MPRPNDYSRKRYIAMQCVMWLLFAASLAVAAFTSSARQAGLAKQLELGKPIDMETISVQVPAKWKHFATTPGEIHALEPTRHSVDSRARSFEITEYEPQKDSGATTRPARARRRKGDQEIPMGPITGTVGTSVKRIPLFDTDQLFEVTQIRAAGTLPSGRIVSVTLTTAMDDDDGVDAEDMALLKQVANSIKLLDADEDRPQMKSAPTSTNKD